MLLIIFIIYSLPCRLYDKKGTESDNILDKEQNPLSTEDWLGLMSWATFFGIPALNTLCYDALERLITVENVASIWQQVCASELMVSSQDESFANEPSEDSKLFPMGNDFESEENVGLFITDFCCNFVTPFLNASTCSLFSFSASLRRCCALTSRCSKDVICFCNFVCARFNTLLIWECRFS